MSSISEKKEEVVTVEVVDDTERHNKPFVKSKEEVKLKRKIDRVFAPFVIVLLFTQVIILRERGCGDERE
jgi:hypothetical protein